VGASRLRVNIQYRRVLNIKADCRFFFTLLMCFYKTRDLASKTLVILRIGAEPF
jgi:hypothetical protein